MVLSLNGAPTITLIPGAYLNDPQYKSAPNNNADPGGQGPFNLFFPTNLNEPPQ